MSGPAPRRAIDRPKRLVTRLAAPGVVVAGLVATGLALAAVPSPTLATSASVAAGGTGSSTSPGATPAATDLTSARFDARDFAEAQRGDRADRGTQRETLDVVGHFHLSSIGSRYATTALTVRTDAADDAAKVAVLKAGARVLITDTTEGEWRLIVRDDQGQWVKKKYLSSTKPTLTAGGDLISSSPCKSGSAMESGLAPNAVKVHRALCARYPQVSAYGGVRQGDGGEHGTGHAVDAMISNSTVGWQMARWLRANARALGVSQVIYSQHIWTVQRSSEGWRSMSDRGSATANHYDHVHVTVY